jgi:hypothetical protein
METAAVALGVPLVAGVSVWLACGKLIRIPAIRLLQGEQPAARRASSRHTSSRGLYTRLIFRNMQSDLRRVLVTIASIAGCCLLLVVGFMLKYAIERTGDRQFGQIIQYQAELYFDPAEAGADGQLADILAERQLPFVLVGKADFILREGESFNTATAIAAEPGSLEGYYSLSDPAGKALQLSDEGALIPIRMSEYLGMRAGDSLTAFDADLMDHSLPIAGVFRNYFGNLMFFTPAGYEGVFDAKAEQNCFLIRMDGMSLEELEAAAENVRLSAREGRRCRPRALQPFFLHCRCGGASDAGACGRDGLLHRHEPVRDLYPAEDEGAHHHAHQRLYRPGVCDLCLLGSRRDDADRHSAGPCGRALSRTDGASGRGGPLYALRT